MIAKNGSLMLNSDVTHNAVTQRPEKVKFNGIGLGQVLALLPEAKKNVLNTVFNELTVRRYPVTIAEQVFNVSIVNLGKRISITGFKTIPQWIMTTCFHRTGNRLRRTIRKLTINIIKMVIRLPTVIFDTGHTAPLI
jgi:hypothetical protein